ncbi:MAG: leucyl/phenylalanyl-tRNA--protein transferase [Deltaproteobacteria bacterium]|jgi:leucyl/phenylalanyl-tRNA--protein transferase
MPVFRLSAEIIFPPPQLAREDGLLAVGGDLSEERLLLAYRRGIFPWYSPGDPILWWAPSPRLILEPKKFHLSRRLAREIRKGTFTVTMDRTFREVMEACAAPREKGGPGTWINLEMIAAYCHLHDSGFAHSMECWQAGELVGGLYGISLGTVFFGESMFSRVSNSSKVALAALCRQLSAWKFEMIDCQMKTTHLERLGAREIPGPEFYHKLARCMQKPTRRGKWQLTTSL